MFFVWRFASFFCRRKRCFFGVLRFFFGQGFLVGRCFAFDGEKVRRCLSSSVKVRRVFLKLGFF